MQDHLEELTRVRLLKTVEKGVRSGKTRSTIYVKNLPPSLSSDDIHKFTMTYLKPIRICWSDYIKYCKNVILSAPSATLSSETSTILQKEVYKWFVLF